VSDETPDLDGMLGFLAEDGRRRRDPEDHPSAETLTTYQANELTADEDERIQSHLAVCSHCTELLLDLNEFLQPPAAPEPVADFEAAANWRKLRENLGRPETKSPVARPDRRRFFASVWGGYSVAAALLILTVGLGARNGELARELKKPQPLGTPKTLTAEGSSRGSENPKADEPIALPAQIVLILSTDRPAPSYRLEILDEEKGKLQGSLDVPYEDGELSFNLPKQALTPGTYTLRVSARGKEQRIWKYRLSVGPSAD
jgi:Putative zinc-finger